MSRPTRYYLRAAMTLGGLAILFAVAYLVFALAGRNYWVLGYISLVFVAGAVGSSIRFLVQRGAAARRR